MKIEELHKLFLAASDITTDSRDAKPDSIFFALKGDNFDGNKYAEKALEAGCLYAVIDDDRFKLDERCILVDDVLNTLQQLSRYHRREFNIPILAITGSNGKTTTKELVSSILGRKYRIISTEGNFNNHIGVPLTLLRLKEDTEIGIIELGANHPGEISDLCQLAEPTHGIITNIGHAHIEGFGSFENVIKAKSELYSWLRNNNGIIFQNLDDEILEGLIQPEDNLVPYSVYSENLSDFSIVAADPHLEVNWKYNNKVIPLKTQLFGTYNLQNLVAAISIGLYFDVDENEIKSGTESFSPGNNRSQVFKTYENTLILDAYNANPTSMKAAIADFQQISAVRKMVILGDMFELGEDSLEQHKEIIALLEDMNHFKAYLVGEMFTKASEGTHLRSFPDVDEASRYFMSHPVHSSTILLKGSRMMSLEKLIPNL